MPRQNTQPVRISEALLTRIEAEAKANFRSIPMEIEKRLTESLAPPAEEAVRSKGDGPSHMVRLDAALYERMATKAAELQMPNTPRQLIEHAIRVYLHNA